MCDIHTLQLFVSTLPTHKSIGEYTFHIHMQVYDRQNVKYLFLDKVNVWTALN